MSFRRRMLAVLALTVIVTVVAVAWVVSVRTRRAFEGADEERTAALVAQFRREFARRGGAVARAIEGVASSENVHRMALEVARGGDPAAYVSEAASVAQAHQLDFLEFLGPDGTIISSAQSPARFGYKEAVGDSDSGGAFLKREELPDGVALGLFAMRTVWVGDKPVHILGGERLDRDFLGSLTLPAGMRVFLYRTQDGTFAAPSLIGPDGPVAHADALAPLVSRVQERGEEVSGIVNWSADPAGAESFQAIPLKENNGALLGILLVGSSRHSLVELQHHIRTVALVVGGVGILLAIALSLWLAARITRPVEQLAEAARAVGAGNWNTRVQLTSGDELEELAEAFNLMTRELSQQRERLVQAERVAAWRELARRLAHELKNPLMPVQLTVENLLRARELSPEQFEEVFRESTATLLAEIANMKAIIGRFSDFSKMPQPQLQPVAVNEVARQVLSLHEAQFQAAGRPPITTALDLNPALPQIKADPELLHRVISNLVLNALDAMPDGGTLTIRTENFPDCIQLEVRDTGTGLTREECERLFTPYYTTKRHGTGLGLAIVQSIVSDHKGNISVESTPGQGTSFRVQLPKQRQCSQVAGAPAAKS